MSTEERWSTLKNIDKEYCIYKISSGPQTLLIQEALLPSEIDPDAVAREARRLDGILIGLPHRISPCSVASAILHAVELTELGYLRVKNRNLAVLILIHRVSQIGEILEKVGKVRVVVASGVSTTEFSSVLEKLTGVKWRARECSVECSPDDIGYIALHAAHLL